MILRVLAIVCLITAGLALSKRYDVFQSEEFLKALKKTTHEKMPTEQENLVQTQAASSNLVKVHPLLTSIVTSQLEIKRVGQLLLLKLKQGNRVHILTVRFGFGVPYDIVHKIFGWIPKFGQFKVQGHTTHFVLHGSGISRNILITPHIQKLLNLLLYLKWRTIAQHTVLFRRGHCVLVYRKDPAGALILNRRVCYGHVANLARFLTGHAGKVTVDTELDGFHLKRNGRLLRARVAKGAALIRLIKLLETPENQRFLDMILSGEKILIKRQPTLIAGHVGDLHVRLENDYGLNTVIIKGGSLCDKRFEAEFGAILPNLDYSILRAGNGWHVVGMTGVTITVNRVVNYRKLQIVVLKHCLTGMVQAIPNPWTGKCYVLWKRGPHIFVRHGITVSKLHLGTPTYYRVNRVLVRKPNHRVVICNYGANQALYPKNHVLRLVVQNYLNECPSSSAV
eukprot:TRINITY_DN324_c0_g1_i1.p1 TRINITY_DN324_c0_g1~~TRINITY_DN324_c0_g1_i1.p1  ORF type:complete len:452 (+),score=115.70 TRINITY_DN324_c0_g1_i1:419-1774(+)